MMRNNKPFIIFILIMVFLAGCAPSAASEAQGSVQDNTMSEGAPAAVGAVTSIPTSTPEPTEVPFTPTPDLRTPPDQWKDWDIVPEITNRSIEIYQYGREKGVNSLVFSKIGDCQNVSSAFLGIYDKPGRYFLTEENQGWQLTIDNFTGYFDRDGYAFGQGLNVAGALSPFQADPDVCLPSEGPLQCELRVVNPSIAFVSFERWYNEETPPEVYEKYLRVVLDTIIENGTVPILITKADNIEGGHQINQIIANLAFEYDIPLYNWWKAAQFLSNNGMDPERNDGFHISVEGWNNRSYYALQTLDQIWKGLEQ